MVRISIAFALAAAFTLAGLAVEFDAFLDRSPIRFVVGGIAIVLGLVWLWNLVQEWRTKIG